MSKPKPRSIDVEIYDQKYSIVLKSAISEADFRELADIVDTRMREIASVASTPDSLKIAVLTALQVRVWTDSETLFEHALTVTGPHPQMLDLAASAHARRGDDATAVRYWRQSLVLMPDGPFARQELAQALARHRPTASPSAAETKAN